MRRWQDVGWQDEVDDLLHGIAGAFLFGTPLLYTMEVWWKGNFTTPARMLAALAITFSALLALDAAAGFRRQRATTPPRMLADSAEALALGLVAAAVSLFLLRRIGPGVGPEALAGRIILLSIPFSIGIGIANGLLRVDAEDTDGDRVREDANNPSAGQAILADAGATLLGATIVAFSIAPTDEVPMIAAALSGPWLLALILASLALSYVIVFEAAFGYRARRARRGVERSPLAETVSSYVLSLAMAALMLWLFQSVNPGDPPTQWLSYVIVLGLPATIGGAAGRLAI